jgi:chaperonin GroEL (HSP60 family)
LTSSVPNQWSDSKATIDCAVDPISAHTKTTTTANITQAATASTNDDTHVDKLIAQVMEKVDKESVITFKERRTIEDKNAFQ